MTDNHPTELDTMAFRNRTQYLSVGTEIDGNPSGEEMRKAAGLDFEVEKVPLAGIYENSDRVIQGVYGIRRNDTGHCIDNVVVGKEYGVIQNESAFALSDHLQREGLVQYEAAGTLRGGAKVWALAKMCNSHGEGLVDTIHRLDGTPDPVGRYVLFTNSFDGSSKYTIGLTPLRFHCTNQLNAAIHGMKMSVRIGHTRIAAENAEETAHSVFGEVLSGYDSAVQVWQRLDDSLSRTCAAGQGLGAAGKPRGVHGAGNGDDMAVHLC